MAYNNNNNNSNDDLVAFLVPHKDKNDGTYWKATMDLGGGKAVKFTMFENTKPDTKSDFILKGYKKAYNTQPRKSKTW